MWVRGQWEEQGLYPTGQIVARTNNTYMYFVYFRIGGRINVECYDGGERMQTIRPDVQMGLEENVASVWRRLLRHF